MSRIFLDHNSTTRPLPEVVEAITRHARESYANPGSRHAEGRIARRALEDAREKIAAILHARPSEVIFTSGGTEAINLAILGLTPRRPATVLNNTVLTTAGEHPAVRQACRRLQEDGAQLQYLDVDREGRLVPEQLDEISWDEIGLAPSSSATVRDVWTGRSLGSHTSQVATTVGAEDVQVFIIRGTDAQAVRYEAASSANELEGGAVPEACNVCAGGKSVKLGGERSIIFKIVPVKRPTYVRIEYVNRQKSPIAAGLGVNGQVPLNVLFPPTGNAVGAIVVEVELVDHPIEIGSQFGEFLESLHRFFAALRVLGGQV